IAQWESVPFTPERSLVQSQLGPPLKLQVKDVQRITQASAWILCGKRIRIYLFTRGYFLIVPETGQESQTR
ncbi:hypothetical protein ACGLFO_11955, partial [Corynebacterium hesseae]|uniref:hypothetical protein n=1 Tax=Corynebacterium hesseae TaxID=2913502 RepID=UPI00373EE151